MKQTSTTNTSATPDDDAPELRPEDFARARHRVGMQDVSREQWATAVREKLGKQRVSIMLDTAVIAFFKARAGERGYQTLINQALRDVVAGVSIVDAVRQTIREELSTG